MSNIKRRVALKSSLAALAGSTVPRLSAAQSASPGPSYTVEDLRGNTLTPFGSVRAGNADGSIPAWTGENLPLPAGFEDGMTPQYFTDEKPRYSVTGASMAQYKDKLAIGVQALLQKYPDFRMDVYPTHRTAIAPQYVYDYIYKNATSARLSADGNSVTEAYGGIPFPFPKNGHEVIWNHELAWVATTVHYVAASQLVTESGEVVFESKDTVWQQFPYYFENGESRFNGFYNQAYIVPTAPPYQAGTNILNLMPLNPEITPVEAWEYLVGERRVRRAPELQYDTPNSISGGVSNWDEAFIFSGKLDRYDFNYTGIKEMIVPYNCNKFNIASVADQFNPHFMNPDLIRWELHRVRVVEMTLKPGARDVDVRRTIYCDEDTGSAVMGDVYDAAGLLWKFQHTMPAIYPNVPALVATQNFALYDLHAGRYICDDSVNKECSPQWKPVPELPASFMTPGHLASSAGGF